ncbi:MAG: helix-hairpin-helix domain-containing protein [Candidatus Marinimicrobia bacterium]|nr:helix-hairpin-helix domain-containing protein [Candidatus Neomarinimicrobiota bacterium]
MQLFTPQEKKALWYLLILLLVGTGVRNVRQYRAARIPLAEAGYGPLFQAGTEAYRATSIDEPVAPIDLNHATGPELRQLPGVGPVMAKKIIDYRLKNGYFRSVEGLMNVDGVGPKRLAQWRDLLVLSDSAVQAETASSDSL